MFIYEAGKTMPAILQPRFDQVEGVTRMRDESTLTRKKEKEKERQTDRDRARGEVR